MSVDDVRIRSGQRKCIFATAAAVGLRDEQLHDLVEAATGDRTRAIARMTIGEARWLIGTLKTMERNARRLAAAGAGQATAATEISETTAAQAARRARPPAQEKTA